jgi:hypothetical protein
VIPLPRKVAEAAPDVQVFQYRHRAALFQKGDHLSAKPARERAANAKGEYPGKGEAQAMLGSI